MFSRKPPGTLLRDKITAVWQLYSRGGKHHTQEQAPQTSGETIVPGGSPQHSLPVEIGEPGREQPPLTEHVSHEGTSVAACRCQDTKKQPQRLVFLVFLKC